VYRCGFHAAALCDFQVETVHNEEGIEIAAPKFSTREGHLKLILAPTLKSCPGCATGFRTRELSAGVRAGGCSRTHSKRRGSKCRTAVPTHVCSMARLTELGLRSAFRIAKSSILRTRRPYQSSLGEGD
jgi:hypothetical protein